MIATKIAKTHYSEAEAADALGVSIEQFRTLVRSHIAQGDEDMHTISSATFQASDLLVLRLLSGLQRGQHASD
jgi:hypothetical protein